MMAFELNLEMLDGPYKDHWVCIKFESDEVKKALDFCKEARCLKTWNNIAVTWGDYILRKRFFHLLWLPILQVSKNGEVLFAKKDVAVNLSDATS
jgi:hypothetical protein